MTTAVQDRADFEMISMLTELMCRSLNVAVLIRVTAYCVRSNNPEIDQSLSRILVLVQSLGQIEHTAIVVLSGLKIRAA